LDNAGRGDARRTASHSRTVLAAVLAHAFAHLFACILVGVLAGVRKADVVLRPEVYKVCPETFFEKGELAFLGQVLFRMFWKRKNPAQVSVGYDSPAEAVKRIAVMSLPHTTKLHDWRQRPTVKPEGPCRPPGWKRT